MEVVNKARWNEAIKEEDSGWDFHDQNMYLRHERGNQHGQIVTYAKHMMLFTDFKDFPNPNEDDKYMFDYTQTIFNLQGKTVVDICGGPSSLLLRCHNFKKAIIVDPGSFPDYIINRYREHGIEIAKVPAEEFKYAEKVDEVWMYNALAHVYNPYQILLNAKNNTKTLRIIEGINCGTNTNHPQNLTAEEFENILDVKGSIVDTLDKEPSPRGLHFVGVFHF